ncbi:MAG: DUF1801 domain-containing protein [Gammaproteobacteria bacterium]|nr:DUF1801 domain-containing protein [Gammaproteobacteria bacterium]
MAELKTRENQASVAEFLKQIDDKQKRADCQAIAKMMRDATGKRAKMWGASIVGFDRYDYQYESGRSGSFMQTGFSPRAKDITIYIMHGFDAFASLMKKLGKYKTGKSCLYINRLEDVDQKVLARLIRDSVRDMRRRYPAQK